ncbi:histidine kinase [Leptospira perolatii]|uniref:Histidine kinase n=2 Tax=Leptospira perolatii TaxID=2023191 RepID=A0A2M9ZPP2_9LEPT|nr:histidine kinase [Leptospira perolatii]PJZ74048.1 histidine kinase [Leptospira perolatii]
MQNRKLLCTFFCIVFLLFVASPTFAQAGSAPSSDRFSISEKITETSLLPYLKIYKDETGKLGFLEASKLYKQGKFESLTTNSIGYSKAAIWVCIKVENTLPKVSKWILEIDYALLDYIDLFTSESGAKPLYATGDMKKFGSRPIEHRNFAFRFDEAPKSQKEIYFRIASSSSIILPFIAFTQNEFGEHVLYEQLALGFYYGSMLVMVIYNLFLLLSTRDKSYLFYVSYILSYILFQFTLNGLSFQYLWRNSVWWGNYSLPFLIFCTLSNAAIFSRSFLQSRRFTPTADKIYFAVIGLNAIGMIGTLFVFEYRIAIVASIVSMFLTLGFSIFNGWQCLIRGNKTARFFLLAWTLFVTFSFLFGLKSFGILPNNFFTLWGIQVGSVMEVSLLSLGLADRIKGLSEELGAKASELQKIRLSVEESEAKYRSLFEAEEDFLFSLDQNWFILTANRSVSKHLGFRPADLVGKNFMEIVYKQGELQDAYTKLYVLEKLEELLSEEKPIRFQTEFMQKYLREPKELQVQFQILEYEGQKEILGRAFEPDQDLSSRFLDDEKITYSTNNYLQNAELVSQRLTVNLYRFTDPATIAAIRNCLREMIINAIEHGNLNISFDEKTKAMADGNYFKFIQKRQKDPYYKDKKVKVEYSLSRNRIGVRITDEGRGFNHARLLKNDLDTINLQGLSHGRGLTLARATFDVVRFNSAGNQISVVKYF